MNKKYNRTAHQTQILNGMNRVYKKMLEFKIRKKSKVVVIRDEKIVKVKPEEEI